MSRLPAIDPDRYTGPQQVLFETLASRPEVAAHGVVGPFAAWMHAPEIGSALAAVGAEVRFSASLPANVTEVAICTTGARCRAAFEFAAHRGLAVAAGVDEAALDRLAAGDDPGFDGDEAAAHAVASELLGHHTISDETYRNAVERFGSRGMVELVTTVGYYSLNAMLLNGFEIELAPGMAEPWPG
jgi:4-carboxymuconolactone decarboxylase